MRRLMLVVVFALASLALPAAQAFAAAPFSSLRRWLGCLRARASVYLLCSAATA